MTDWKDTTLWKQLETASGPEADAARALLIQEMPRIQAILTQAHTAPTDFTLHDADHSFRVAKWMAEIIPGDVLEKLSPYEITLLLLAAYLHDIGMTPEQGRVERFWYHLVYGAPDPKTLRQPLTEEEAHGLQSWLDDDGRELTIPLAPDGAASEETQRLADLLVAHYCRYKHNDWSGDWIRTNLNRKALLGYETWMDDLIQLCRSHHEGYDELKQGRFDPRPAGPSSQPAHHRYLACVLRVADVLEIDPERTPEVIFRHREIHPGSVLYWRKDHENWIIRDGNNLSLAAYPESAVLENAIRKTAEGIRQELATCARLNREQPFFYWQLRPTQPLPHRWDFPEVLTERIQPRNDAYVYIDGAFRPNTEKLLDLLSGTQLYGDPLVAVRELLQNAFDAVKEEMAYQRLERPNDPEFAKHLAATHRVELRLEERDGHWWLFCKDTGIGMTRRIIENYVLVSGNSRRREIVELERRCREAGFRLGRTGQFGIGVLSYFMLADRVEIRTKRSGARGDAETTGWSFVTEGVGSFGELKAEPSAVQGTEVRLRLRDELNWKQLVAYIEGTVRYIPCTLDICGSDKTGEAISWKKGWVHSLEEPTQWLFKNVRWLGAGPERRSAHDGVKIMREALRWRVEEGELPDNLGIYRVAVPWFELPGGRCEAFMCIQSMAKRKVITPLMNDRIGLLPRLGLVESIHGISVDTTSSDREEGGVGFLEINWENSEAGCLRVDRSFLNTSLSASSTVLWVQNRAHEILKTVLTEEPSEYTFLSEGWLKSFVSKPRWVLKDPCEPMEFFWGDVPFPVASAADFKSVENSPSFRRKRLAVISSIPLVTGWLDTELFPSFFQLSPDKLATRNLQPPSFGVVRLWERFPKRDRQCLLGSVSQFPPEWGKICGISFSGDATIWNVDHPMATKVDKNTAGWFKLIPFFPDADTIAFSKVKFADLEKDISAAQVMASQALARMLKSRRAEDAWVEFLERDASLARRLLRTALRVRNKREDEWAVSLLKSDNLGGWKLVIFKIDSASVTRPGDPLFEEFLPHPGPDWVITEADSDDEPT